MPACVNFTLVEFQTGPHHPPEKDFPWSKALKAGRAAGQRERLPVSIIPRVRPRSQAFLRRQRRLSKSISSGAGARHVESVPPSALATASGRMRMARRWWRMPAGAAGAAGVNCIVPTSPSVCVPASSSHPIPKSEPVNGEAHRRANRTTSNIECRTAECVRPWRISK